MGARQMMVCDGMWTITVDHALMHAATCPRCRNRSGLMLAWEPGFEEDAEFRCPCGRTWRDPRWADRDAIRHVTEVYGRVGPARPAVTHGRRMDITPQLNARP
jgi:hypothetical protein